MSFTILPSDVINTILCLTENKHIFPVSLVCTYFNAHVFYAITKIGDTEFPKMRDEHLEKLAGYKTLTSLDLGDNIIITV